jgi:hypothetical protein
MDPINIAYRITGPNEHTETFRVKLDHDTLTPLETLPGDLPAWTALDFHQCGNCPLSPDTTPHCPLAARLVPVIDRLGDLHSTDSVKVEVRTEERTVLGQVQAQEAISSLMGLLIAVSGCPHTAFFRPIARYHLPLASLEESLYRALCTYAMAQHIRHRRGQSVDWAWEGLEERYLQVQIVNQSLASRLRYACRNDSTVNALIMLDMLNLTLPEMSKEVDKRFETMFEAFL